VQAVTVAAAETGHAREAQPADYSRPGLSLRRAFEIFAATFSLRLLGPLTAATLVVRLVLGGWTRWDAVVAGAILGLQPFTEWVIHVTVLHWKPKQVGRYTIDPLGARRHRQHHRRPKVIGLVLVPRQVLIGSTLIGIPFYLLVAPTVRLAATALLTSYVMYLLYEWTHFLIHSSYPPRSRYYRYVHRAHRLHHFRNEKFWFGVTVHIADHVLRTFPAKDAVPVSDTAFTLGVDLPG
jgi:hypothetical protein